MTTAFYCSGLTNQLVEGRMVGYLMKLCLLWMLFNGDLYDRTVPFGGLEKAGVELLVTYFSAIFQHSLKGQIETTKKNFS
jgi:hypothetical protein